MGLEPTIPPLEAWCLIHKATCLHLAMGAPVEDDDNSGKARVYKYEEDNWVLKDTFDGKTGNGRFGTSVSVSGDGNTVVIGPVPNKTTQIPLPALIPITRRQSLPVNPAGQLFTNPLFKKMRQINS